MPEWPLSSSVEKRRIAPGIQRIDPLFGLPCFTGFFGMHVNTKRTAVYLGDPDLDQVFVYFW